MSLGVKLNQLREERRQSLQDVATAIGISKTHLWELEKARATNPSMDLLKKLAQHYAVTVEFLVDASSEDNKSEDASVQKFFRDFKSLSPKDQALIQETIDRLKR